MNNSFSKYCPNVFVIKSVCQYNKGDAVLVTTKWGSEVECLIHNLVAQRDGFFYYSQTRTDGTNNQTRAEGKAEKYEKSAERAIDKSQEFWEKSKKGASFLSLGEPIKVGHHSESRHRAMIENNWNNLGKSVEAEELAKTYDRKSNFWDKKSKVIDLSMPESIEFFRQKLQEATEFRDGMKSGKIPRAHSYSLSYATKDVKDLTDKVETAMKLWGDSTPAAPEKKSPKATDKREMTAERAERIEKLRKDLLSTIDGIKNPILKQVAIENITKKRTEIKMTEQPSLF